ncbi:MAG: hypothetical protein AAFQ65_09080 [Myxococcota bacterium]
MTYSSWGVNINLRRRQSPAVRALLRCLVPNAKRISACLLALGFVACGSRQGPPPGRLPNAPSVDRSVTSKDFAPDERPPAWVVQLEFAGGELCGLGVAGAGFYEDSPYPKRLSRERAVRNLAGILGTQIQEAIIDESSSRVTSVRLARLITVDDALIAKIDDSAEVDYWLDRAGSGPFAQKGFTYAKACLDAHTAATLLDVSDEVLEVAAASNARVDPYRVPDWIDRRGKQPGGRLCTVGFSMPMFHPDKTFGAVVEDVRVKLAQVIRTLVSNYYEELTINDHTYQEMITVASTEAVSNGVIVTDYWYDQDGIGPFSRRRSTYGWGCIYPVDVLAVAFEAVEEAAPEDDRDALEQVRERAEAAFDDLDAEIEKREQSPAEPALTTDADTVQPSVGPSEEPSAESSGPSSTESSTGASGGAPAEPASEPSALGTPSPSD